MKIKLLSPLWGHEQHPIGSFLDKIRDAGYDGVDSWIPKKSEDKSILFDYLQRHELLLVMHQHEADGQDFKAFKQSFLKNLKACAEPGPLLINSHTGRDYFSLEHNIELLDLAAEFSAKTGILVCHESHRGRLGYSPQHMAELLNRRPETKITADLSHWVCVTESMLENFGEILNRTLNNSRHIHARVGYEQGPQVSDPRAPEWAYAVNNFLGWWDQIVLHNVNASTNILSITTEFGPAPYMPVLPFSNTPVADQFEINCFMKTVIQERYKAYL